MWQGCSAGSRGVESFKGGRRWRGAVVQAMSDRRPDRNSMNRYFPFAFLHAFESKEMIFGCEENRSEVSGGDSRSTSTAMALFFLHDQSRCMFIIHFLYSPTHTQRARKALHDLLPPPTRETSPLPSSFATGLSSSRVPSSIVATGAGTSLMTRTWNTRATSVRGALLLIPARRLLKCF